MGYVQRRHESGLVLAESAGDETAISRALKRLHPDLVLQVRPRDEEKGGVLVYKVIQVVSDTYAPIVFTWIDEHGRPLPLSSGLVTEVQRHMKGERTDLVSDDEHNRRLVEATERDYRREREALLDDHRARIDRGQTQVSLAHHRRLPAHMKKARGRVVR